jgi:hypothetical protein
MAEQNGQASAVTIPPLTPEGMLAEYRRLSPPDMIEQADQFRRMALSEQRQLLFYMIAHATRGLQILHGIVDPKSQAQMNYRNMSPTKQ